MRSSRSIFTIANGDVITSPLFIQRKKEQKNKRGMELVPVSVPSSFQTKIVNCHQKIEHGAFIYLGDRPKVNLPAEVPWPDHQGRDKDRGVSCRADRKGAKVVS